ncbi:MAG: succinate dehydrogenase, cytochrome b556 subunit [Alphaproteobacteria bacterium]|nr:succinate dehydrogenase, cytochrome b556 subunit [Alphaproteobacteria bacterium]HPF45255.1 succinate dehydrogenase, cytochrome b556 subunit [Emcibacteraceae bacterium]HRW30829.1 succinate dehydrogenase, cytochrome b556 subunit [Emcibacteraceae bacterium]
MSDIKRPTSPHLQVYSWSLEMALSILHRATGVALGGGVLLMTWWIISTATGPDAYDQFRMFMSGIIGKTILFGFTFSLMLHLCNGIRHLFWDMGKGFELEDTHRSSKMVLFSSILLTILCWVIGYGLI